MLRKTIGVCLATGAVLFLLMAQRASAQDSKAGTGPLVAEAKGEGNAGPAVSPVPPGVASAQEVSALKEEMQQLRSLVEEQKAELAKLKGNSSISAEPASQPPSSPMPTPALAPPPVAQDTPEESIRPFKIGGFANWAFGKTSNINDYDLATQHGRYDNLDIGMILTLGLTTNVNATAQFSFQSAGDHAETDVDFAFIDWKINDKLSIRAGQNKNPFGLYSEYMGVGTIYPFNNTPQSIYGGTSIGNEFYRGVGISGRGSLSRNWEMNYDLFFGGLLNDELNPAEKITDAVAAGQGSVLIETTSEEIRQALGGRLSLGRPESGLQFGIDGSTGIAPDRGRHNVVGAFARYETGKLLLRSEFAQSFEPGFIHFSGAYLEAGYKLTRHWQPVFRYDWAHQGLHTGVAIPESFFRHREIGGGMNYWINSKALVKVSYHHVDGNLLAVPQADPIDINNLNTTPTKTDLATIGLAFVF